MVAVVVGVWFWVAVGVGVVVGVVVAVGVGVVVAVGVGVVVGVVVAVVVGVVAVNKKLGTRSCVPLNGRVVKFQQRFNLEVVYPSDVACGVLLSDTCWGGVVGLSAIEFKAHITAGTFDVPTQGEPFIREARTHPFNSTQEQRGRSMTPNAAPRQGEVPHSDSAERQLIGAVLNDEPTALAERVNTLDPACFFVPENRAVWRAFGWLWHRGEPVTVPTVCHALAELGYLDALDKLLAPHLYAEPFLFVLMDENYSAYGCGAWAKMVKEYAERRALIKTGTKMVQQGYGAESKWVDKYEGMF